MIPEEELTQTRTRFGTQKGISSDEFFGRERFDPNAQAEAKQRLQTFDGATSISSNAYFGRPEDELAAIDDGYGDLETAAKDFVRRFGITAGDDLENLSQLVGEGATKLQGKSPYATWLMHSFDHDIRRHPQLSEQLNVTRGATRISWFLSLQQAHYCAVLAIRDVFFFVSLTHISLNADFYVSDVYLQESSLDDRLPATASCQIAASELPKSTFLYSRFVHLVL